MKFSLALSALLLAASASAASVTPRQANKFGGGFGGKGGFGGNKGGQTGGNKGGQAGGNKGGNQATSTTAAAATNTAAAGNNGANTGGNGGNNGGNAGANNGDPQTSTTLLQSVIATGFENNGQAAADKPAAGQVASLTSSNNFINFCATVPNLPITNGQQIKTGSCNPAPMGVIIAQDKMPASKFVSPTNFQAIKANTQFTIQMGIKNLVAGNFVNAQTNYYAAPQQVDSNGIVIGHTHFVIEDVGSFTSTNIPNNVNFAFFQGVDTAAQGGIVSVAVTKGLPVGTYRLASINAAANHQPTLVAVAQHGSLDDMVYFEVTADGQPSNANPGGGAGAGGNAGGNGGNNTGANAGGNNTGANAGGNKGNQGNNNAATSTTAAAAAATSAAAANTGGNKGGQGGKGGFGGGKFGGGKFGQGKGKRFEGFSRVRLNRA